ncbi:hypothetical protein ACFQQB_56250 [Nonomuraea rubra]|uniref:hypothetical protein n=1 Tax=Nonomuraea rubra TaxID=46180 RepID=UPI0031EBD81B
MSTVSDGVLPARTRAARVVAEYGDIEPSAAAVAGHAVRHDGRGSRGTCCWPPG